MKNWIANKFRRATPLVNPIVNMDCNYKDNYYGDRLCKKA